MSQSPHKPSHDTPPSTPRWVKLFGIITLILIIIVVIALVFGVGGPHGPGRHMSLGSAFYVTSLLQ